MGAHVSRTPSHLKQLFQQPLRVVVNAFDYGANPSVFSPRLGLFIYGISLIVETALNYDFRFNQKIYVRRSWNF